MSKSLIKRLRVTFEETDGQGLLWVRPAKGRDVQQDKRMPVRSGVRGVNAEFEATGRELWRGAKLNLLDVVVDSDGVLIPGFIVLEPDYLIDVSTLAACFHEYGHHPATYLMARLTPRSNTGPILLGNIINLFLDEWIHSTTPPDYRDCMRKAFRTYPLELATCPDLMSPEGERQFFDDCKTHFDHIREVVTHVFRRPDYSLDREDAVIEPSYICEPLGLQGRLDYMQRDGSALIEMKSGKADEFTRRGSPLPRESHQVQMLLYQAILEYTVGRDRSRVQAYLLYTRYPLLYPAMADRALVRRAIDLRNRIVATDYGVHLHGSTDYTASRLAEINGDVMNERGLQGKLWRNYQRPPIDRLAQRMQSLTPLERSYFLSLYNFITSELYITKTGYANQEGRSGMAALWLSTLDEKLAAGEIITDLRIAESRADDAGAPIIKFVRTDGMGFPTQSQAGTFLPMPNFRLGDAVVVYERLEPAHNVTNRMVFKGNVESITARTLVVRLRNPQHNPRVLPVDSRYALEHDTMDTGFRAMYAGLAAFLTASPHRRDLLLGQRMPLTDYRPDEVADEAAPAVNPTIASQAGQAGENLAEVVSSDLKRIVRKAVTARDYFLLMGPPGTGKTSRALRGMVEAHYALGQHILLLSYTNRAVDEICRMLATISPPVDFIRVGTELNCEETFRPHLAQRVMADCTRRSEVRERLETCRIFVGTVATLSLHTELLRFKAFDVALVDEATQILEPQLLGLLCLRTEQGKEVIGKFILVGDQKQLPAVVVQSADQSAVTDEALRAIGLKNLRDSLFERLLRTVGGVGGSSEIVRCPFADLLAIQGRMHPAVAAYTNDAFYGGRLRPLGLPHQQGMLTLSPGLENVDCARWLTCRVAFLPSAPESPERSPKTNREEARLAARLAVAIYRRYAATTGFDPITTLGIITPYRAQIAAIRHELAQVGVDALGSIAVDTVERFQGSEREVIIYSFCINRPSQLSELANLMEEGGVWVDRKLNVALTRARSQLFLLGVPALLRQSPIYAALLDRIALSNGEE